MEDVDQGGEPVLHRLEVGVGAVVEQASDRLQRRPAERDVQHGVVHVRVDGVGPVVRLAQGATGALEVAGPDGFLQGDAHGHGRITIVHRAPSWPVTTASRRDRGCEPRK